MLFEAPDMAAFIANRAQKHAPGTFWQYSSGDSNLLAWNLVDTFDSPCQYHAWSRAQFEAMGLRSVVIEPDAAGTPVMSSFGW